MLDPVFLHVCPAKSYSNCGAGQFNGLAQATNLPQRRHEVYKLISIVSMLAAAKSKLILRNSDAPAAVAAIFHVRSCLHLPSEFDARYCSEKHVLACTCVKQAKLERYYNLA